MLTSRWSAVVVLTLAVLPGLAFSAEEGNLLSNGGFEIRSAVPEQSHCPENWPISIGSKSDECHGGLSTDAYRGSHALNMTLKGEKSDLWTGQRIQVYPGMKMNYTLYAKGTAGRSFYIQFTPMNGDKNLETKYIHHPLTADWTFHHGSYTIPPEADSTYCFIHLIGRPVDAFFDEFSLMLAPETTLVNNRIAVSLNPMLGGCIDSLVEKETDDLFNYTIKRQPGEPGGLAIDILPGTLYPGVLADAIYINKTIVPYQEIRLSRKIPDGQWKDLAIAKTYRLPDQDQPVIEVAIEIRNESAAALTFSHRVQNVLPPADGIFSVPTRDWLTIFNRNADAIRSINSLVLKDLRAGWAARAYQGHKGLCFHFDHNTVEKTYSYLVAPHDTLEWYYQAITLKPNEAWNTGYSITLVDTQGKYYDGNLSYQSPPEQIKGVKLPPMEQARKTLPPMLKSYFPFGASLSSCTTPVAAGADEQPLHQAHLRQMRDLAGNYFNNFYGANFLSQDPTAFIALAEKARTYDMTLSPTTHVVWRHNINPEEYLPGARERVTAWLSSEATRQAIAKYKDRILSYYTADEITAQNIGCMLAGHDLLRQALDHQDGAFFPYLNLGGTIYEVAKYLPVYLGDYYPIYKAESLTRNPWAVTREIKAAVMALPSTPVWFMPQGFGSIKSIYAMPTEAEVRLMIYSAVANGAKGIIVYGLHGTSNWMIKAGGEELPMRTGAGSSTPQWKTLGECARELTAIGPSLLSTSPEWDYQGAAVACANITRTSRSLKTYDGPAVTIHGLKHENGKLRFLVMINQDDLNASPAALTFQPQQTGMVCYDLTGMAAVSLADTLNMTLPPGDAKFLVLGPENDVKAVVEQVFTGRSQREKVRFRIAADRAANNGVAVPAVPEGLGQKAYQDIMTAQAQLQATMAASEFGQAMLKWQQTGELLGDLDYTIIRHADLIIPPAIWEQTPNFRKPQCPPDSNAGAALSRVERDFHDYRRLDRAIDAGEYRQRKAEIDELVARIPANAQAMLEAIKNLPGR